MGARLIALGEVVRTRTDESLQSLGGKSYTPKAKHGLLKEKTTELLNPGSSAHKHIADQSRPGEIPDFNRDYLVISMYRQRGRFVGHRRPSIHL